MLYYALVAAILVVAFLYYRYKCIEKYEKEIDLLNNKLKQNEYVIKKFRSARQC